eukprot:Selendium_serpulae@DN11150_c0_g1_i1.p1
MGVVRKPGWSYFFVFVYLRNSFMSYDTVHAFFSSFSNGDQMGTFDAFETVQYDAKMCDSGLMNCLFAQLGENGVYVKCPFSLMVAFLFCRFVRLRTPDDCVSILQPIATAHKLKLISLASATSTKWLKRDTN